VIPPKAKVVGYVTCLSFGVYALLPLRPPSDVDAHAFVLLRCGGCTHSWWYCLLYVPDEPMVQVGRQCVGSRS
jgi:hypothetical protein